MKADFYVTFGVQYSDRGESHPKGGHKDGWVRIVADGTDVHDCENRARRIAFNHFGRKWSMIYGARDWKPEYFPKGELYALDEAQA
jgi:hypothetical protein